LTITKQVAEKDIKMSKYYPPIYGESKFHCAICNVYAQQNWGALVFQGKNNKAPFWYSKCDHCLKLSYWHKEQMIIPGNAPVPNPHEDLPPTCLDDYNEAREIAARSPKAAAALMRLLIQKLLVALGQPGRNINDEIGNLVKAGMPVEVQQALDYCRVVGNNAVHPGEISIDDDPSTAYCLFEMVNFVVEDRITKPKRIADLYRRLPEGALKAVEKRDTPHKA
jgi:Domain of unknown function (DUF4145)